jgi:hypothetical protein
VVVVGSGGIEKWTNPVSHRKAGRLAKDAWWDGSVVLQHVPHNSDVALLGHKRGV